jgi:hypothetical protein
MRRFLYFIPEVGAADTRTLARCGLLSRFTSHGGILIEHGVTPLANGPAGSGVIVSAGAQPPDYAPQRQRWMIGKQFWVGLETPDMPPRPADLEREIGISGVELTLNDSQAWRIPVVRRWNREALQHVPNLPTSLTPELVDGKYTYKRQVSPEYQPIDALAERLWAGFHSNKTLTINQAFADASTLLAVNYRLGEEEAGMLGLLDGDTALAIFMAALDLGAIKTQAIEFGDQGLHASDVVIQDE